MIHCAGCRALYPETGTPYRCVKFGGTFVAVEEDEIPQGRDQLAQLGFKVELTSAIVWRALSRMAGRSPEPIVAILTGAGFKSA